MSAAVRSRALRLAAAAAGSGGDSIFIKAVGMHAGRLSDAYTNINHRRLRSSLHHHFVSIQGELVDRGSLPSTSIATTASFTGDPPEIWQQPPASGDSPCSNLDNSRSKNSKSSKVGFGRVGEQGSWDGCNLGSEFPTPKEIVKGLDKFVIGQERAKKVKKMEEKYG